jgi:hypothetical protein
MHDHGEKKKSKKIFPMTVDASIVST